MRHLAFALVVAMGCGPPSRPSDGDGGTGGDAAQSCMPGEFACFGQILQGCVDGRFEDQQTCPRFCDPTRGCISCFPQQGNTCLENEVHACTPEGSIGELIETCSGSQQCENGRCADVCADAAALRSYIGCEYWAVDLWNALQVNGPQVFGGCPAPPFGPGGTPASLPVCWSNMFGGSSAGLCDNGTDCSRGPSNSVCETHPVCIYDAQHAPFAIVMANPSVTSTVMVTVTTSAGAVATVSVLPGDVTVFKPQAVSLPDQSLAWSSIENKAYHVVSSRPIVAYQFNPLDNVDVFSNDASLLLPVHTYDTKYYVVTQPSILNRPAHHDWGGYVTVFTPTAQVISVTPTVDVKAGLNGAPAIPAGGTAMASLAAGQAWTLEAVAGGDLTGTLVESFDGMPFAAFAGHVATVISTLSAPCCADHLEDQLFPTSTWGKAFAVARSKQRRSEPDRLRIVAQKPATSITFNPSSYSCPSLGPGQYCEVDITSDVEITASEPILIGHFILAVGDRNNPSAGAPGDPSMAFDVPSEQFRMEYDLLVPAEYDENWFAIVTPQAGAVMLDGTDVTSQLSTFGSGAWKAGRVVVANGRHRIECAAGCGVLVGGYGDAVSYLFAGGLDLEQIVVD